MPRFDPFSPARVLAACLLPALLLTGCGKDPEPAPASDAAWATAPGQDGKFTGTIDLFAKVPTAAPLRPSDLTNGKPLVDFHFSSTNAALSPDIKVVYLGKNEYGQGIEGRAVSLLGIELATKQKKSEWPVSGPTLYLVYLSTDGSTLAATFDRRRAPGVIEIYDTATGKYRTRFVHDFGKNNSTSDSLQALALAPNGKTAVSVTSQSINHQWKTYQAWSAETGKPLWSAPAPFYTSNIRFTRDGKLVLCWIKDGPIFLDATTGKGQEQYATNSNGRNCWLELSPDEKEILLHTSKEIAKDKYESYFIKIDRATGNRVYSVRTGGPEAGRILVLPDGKNVGLMFDQDDVRYLQIRKLSNGALLACFRVKDLSLDEAGLLLPDGKTFLLENKLYELEY